MPLTALPICIMINAVCNASHTVHAYGAIYQCMNESLLLVTSPYSCMMRNIPLLFVAWLPLHKETILYAISFTAEFCVRICLFAAVNEFSIKVLYIIYRYFPLGAFACVFFTHLLLSGPNGRAAYPFHYISTYSLIFNRGI